MSKKKQRRTSAEQSSVNTAARSRRTAARAAGLNGHAKAKASSVLVQRRNGASSLDGTHDLKAGTAPVDKRNQLNELTATEWLPETVSVWSQRGLGAGHADAQIEREHPAPFSFTDVGRLIRFFTKQGDLVLDPFVGVGSTSKACAVDGRRSIGFELSRRFAKLATQRLESELRHIPTAGRDQRIVVGDARKLVLKLAAGSVDCVITSPPYWNILHKEDHKANQERKAHQLDTRYGDDGRDLGNIPVYADFLREVSALLGECGRVLKPKKYMAVIVSDFRDKSRFVMFHADLALALEQHGLHLRGITILHQRHKRVFPYGYPYAYVPNIHHQYILILQNVRKPGT